MQIRPSAEIQQNYNEISALCRKTHEPVCLTKNGESDLVVMDVDSFCSREKILELWEALLRVEENRQKGRMSCSVDALDAYLGDVLHSTGNDD